MTYEGKITKRAQSRSRSKRRQRLKAKYGLYWKYNEVTATTIENIRKGQRLGYRKI